MLPAPSGSCSSVKLPGEVQQLRISKQPFQNKTGKGCLCCPPALAALPASGLQRASLSSLLGLVRFTLYTCGSPCFAVWLDLVCPAYHLPGCLTECPVPSPPHPTPIHLLSFQSLGQLHTQGPCPASEWLLLPSCTPVLIHRPEQGSCSILTVWPPWSAGPGLLCVSTLTHLVLVPRGCHGYLCTLPTFPILHRVHEDPKASV